MTVGVPPKPLNPGKPDWLKVRLPGSPQYQEIKARLRRLKLHTVCEEAQCPNIGECWASGTATIMLMGDICTRGCRFCAVTSGRPKSLDPGEPRNVATALAEMGLSYVVITTVDRDDLPDGGAAHIGETIRQCREHCPGLLIETLVPDFGGDTEAVDVMLANPPEVFAHNLETVERLTPVLRDARCDYRASLRVLEHAGRAGLLTKTSLMVGIGETSGEIEQAIRDAREAGVNFLTIGQYLRPSRKHLALQEYVTPERFEGYRQFGEELGFAYVASGPLVRSSYKAGERFIEAMLRAR